MNKYDAVYKGWLKLPEIVVGARDKSDAELGNILHDFMEKMDKAYERRFKKLLKEAFDAIAEKEKAKLN